MNWLHSYGVSFLGGALIGLSASLLLLTHGRVAGIAGLFGGLFLPGHDARTVRLWFVLGLLGAGAAFAIVHPGVFSSERIPAFPILAIAGLLVGYGTRLGGGCTSGHGVCGLSRFSRRSLVATMIFMATGMGTVFLVHHVFGGAR